MKCKMYYILTVQCICNMFFITNILFIIENLEKNLKSKGQEMNLLSVFPAPRVIAIDILV